MRGLVRRGMQEGAYGLSSGPFYTPGSFAKTEELVELAQGDSAVRRPLHEPHPRRGQLHVGMLAAVDEVIRVAEEGGVIGIVSHMKALGPDSWGLAWPAIKHMRGRAGARGLGLRGSVPVRSLVDGADGGARAGVGAGRRRGAVQGARVRSGDAPEAAGGGQREHPAARRRGLDRRRPLRARSLRSKGSTSARLPRRATLPPEVAALDLLLGGQRVDCVVQHVGRRHRARSCASRSR